MVAKVLLVDDDTDLLRLVEVVLRAEGIESLAASTGQAGLDAVSDDVTAVVLDLNLPDLSGKVVLERLLRARRDLPIVVLSAVDAVAEVVDCMRLGALDYVPKPFDRTRLVTSVRNACTQGRLRARLGTLAHELRAAQGLSAILGASPSLLKAKQLVARAAESEVTVLVLGESGTGKEVAARAIHAESSRHSGPFVGVNCGAIPEGLVEAELFGHERGAFTGAISSRPGLFEQAEGGTIFLDEVGELRSDLQVKLLRVLQERVVQRMGATRGAPVDVRVVAATNRDLQVDVDTGRFRRDLYYRLAVFPIRLPALCERPGDVLLLAEHFLERFARRHRRALRGPSPAARAALEAYRWPGNVRELENAIERAVILEDQPELSLGSLPDEVVCAVERDREPAAGAQVAEAGAAVAAEIVPLEQEEHRIIARALELTGWNIRETARRLGIGRATLYRKMERFGLRPPR